MSPGLHIACLNDVQSGWVGEGGCIRIGDTLDPLPHTLGQEARNPHLAVSSSCSYTRKTAFRLAQTWGKCFQICSDLGKMRSNLLTLGHDPFKFAQAVEKMRSNLLKVGENGFRLAQTGLKCVQICRRLVKRAFTIART